jgi:hypothetical protein
MLTQGMSSHSHSPFHFALTLPGEEFLHIPPGVVFKFLESGAEPPDNPSRSQSWDSGSTALMSRRRDPTMTVPATVEMIRRRHGERSEFAREIWATAGARDRSEVPF